MPMQRPKLQFDNTKLERVPLGLSPLVLAKRNINYKNSWCPRQDIECDPWCNPLSPKIISYKNIVKAAKMIREEIPETPIVKSKSNQMGMKLYYKLENFNNTGSYKERCALYYLSMLKKEQLEAGVITASTGNWAMALAYYGRKMKVPVTVVLPTITLMSVVEKCKALEANVILYGDDYGQTKHQAFIIASANGATYINGYDHPNIIAACGSIGLEILEQLPRVDAILVPVGGGGLIAGISKAVKVKRPGVLIYGIQTKKCCSFFKAMENGKPYDLPISHSLAGSLVSASAGYNAFETARSLIDKMVLVDEDWVAKAILHLVEEEKLVVEGAGAVALAALLAVPNIVPELRRKTVVCVITGNGNLDHMTLPRCLERAKAMEGRIIKIMITLPNQDIQEKLRIFSIIANIGCNVLECCKDVADIDKEDLFTSSWTIICETSGIKQACTLKRVMHLLFPTSTSFVEEPFSPIPACICFPTRLS